MADEKNEERIVNMIIGKPGGNAGSTSLNYKISIPTNWAQQLNVTNDNKKMKLSFDGKTIKIEKI